MVSLIDAKVRAFRLRLYRAYLAEPEAGQVDWWRVVKIGSSILIVWWATYIVFFIRSLVG